MKKLSVSHVIGLALITLATGCGTQRLNVQHGSFSSSGLKRTGTVYVGEFRDERSTIDKTLIGIVRNGYNMDMGKFALPENKTVQQFMRSCIVDALEHVGYTVRIVDTADQSRQKQTPLLRGTVQEFWVDGAWNVEAKVKMIISLLDSNDRIQWQLQLAGAEANPSMSFTSPHLKSFREALDMLLSDSVREFASEEFFRKATQQSQTIMTEREEQ